MYSMLFCCGESTQARYKLCSPSCLSHVIQIKAHPCVWVTETDHEE